MNERYLTHATCHKKFQTASKYYNQSGDKMDLIPTLSYGLGVPCCLLATYVVERHGLKNGLQIGGFLTGIGKKFKAHLFQNTLFHFKCK